MLLLMRPRQAAIPMRVPRNLGPNIRPIGRDEGYAATQRVDPSVPAPLDVPAALRELVTLRDESVLTEDEFQAAKAKLLGADVAAS